MKITEDKRTATLLAVLGLVVAMMAQPVSAALFTQDFSSSTNVGSYTDATAPSQNQFNSFLTGSHGTFSINAGTLRFDVTSTTGSSSINRTTAMAGSPVGAVSFSYDLDMSFTSANNTGLILATIGSSAGNWAAYAISSAGTENTWKLNGTTNTFAGTQKLTVVLNDSGSSFSYSAPGGGSESVAFGAYDLWVGNTKVYNDRTTGVNTAADLSVFSISMSNPVGATSYAYDNFNVQAIPEPATLGMFGFAGGVILLIRRRLMK